MKARILTTLFVAGLTAAAIPAYAQGGDASAEYQQVVGEVQALNKKAMRAPSMQARVDMLKEMQALMTDFREKYPGTPEAYDAAFQLGAMAYSLGSFTQESARYREAVSLLSEFVVNTDASETIKLAYAHYYLAESYKGLGEFDAAEGEYKTILNRYRGANARLTQMVQMYMATLDAERRLKIGGEPIDFEVTSLGGETLSPDAYKGKVLLIDFWATWCGPCVQEMPHVKSVYRKYKDKGFEIVGISLDRSRSALDNYIQANGITWPQFFDGKSYQNEVAVQYGVNSIPATFLIDRDGKIRYKALRGPALERAVAELLNEG